MEPGGEDSKLNHSIIDGGASRIAAGRQLALARGNPNAIAGVSGIIEKGEGTTMTPEDRFQRIEGSLQAVADSQLALQAALKGLIESQTRNQETLPVFTKSISQYVGAADARMTRIETNLDGLIRAITAEHANGKSQH